MLDLKKCARELVQNLSGQLGPSAYDVAWLARVPANDGDGARWPDLVEWLIEHQWLDGSWGGAIEYYHDRVLCTLAAIIALREQSACPEITKAIRRGEQYVWNHIHRLNRDPFELVGFELIFPALLSKARTLGLNVPANECGYEARRAEKLRLIPEESLYSPEVPVTFSLEFMDSKGDPMRMLDLQGPNGAIHNSPATTAYFVLLGGPDTRALEYLEQVKALPGGVPAFHPFRVMELSWVLEHLAYGGLKLSTLVDQCLWEELLANVRDTGISIDPTYGIVDGDTTAVTLHTLALGGHPVDPAILSRFEQPQFGAFRTHFYERNVSVSTNVHALGAIAAMPDYPNRQEVWDRVVAYILADRVYGMFWRDKWHASPYYVTSHALVTLANAEAAVRNELTASIDWIVNTQRGDGSWGHFDRGTAEETAYALLALLHWHRHSTADVNPDALRRGASFLRSVVEQTTYAHPALWIVKSLFAPESIIRAAVLAALILYEDTLGRAPV